MSNIIKNTTKTLLIHVSYLQYQPSIIDDWWSFIDSIDYYDYISGGLPKQSIQYTCWRGSCEQISPDMTLVNGLLEMQRGAFEFNNEIPPCQQYILYGVQLR